jgi:hypothetical protein
LPYAGRCTRVQLRCLRLQQLYLSCAVHRDYPSPAARALRRPRRAPRLPVSGRMRSTSTSPCAVTTRLRPHALYVNLAVRREHSSPGCSGSTSTLPRVQVPRHVARLVTQLIALLVVDNSASHRLVVDYFTYVARPGASARHTARHTARRAARHRLLRARHRLLRLRRASGCLGTSRGPSRGSSSTTPCTATSSCGNTGSTTSTPRAATTSSPGRIASTIHLD